MEKIIIDVTNCPYTGLVRKLELFDLYINYSEQYIITEYKIGYWNAGGEFVDYNLISSKQTNPLTGKLNYEKGRNVEFKIDNDTRINPLTGEIIDVNSLIQYEQIPLPIEYENVALPQEFDEEGNPLPIQYELRPLPQQYQNGATLPLDVSLIGMGEFDFYFYLFKDFDRLKAINLNNFNQVIQMGTINSINRGRLL